MFHVKQFSSKKGPKRGLKKGSDPLFFKPQFSHIFSLHKMSVPQNVSRETISPAFSIVKRGLKIESTPFFKNRVDPFFLNKDKI